ncbi:MAG: hypothetical protein AAGL10_13100 [Pseudomonadota bacterium]
MNSSNRPFLLLIMLLAIGLRTALGAPCCAPLTQVHAVEATANHDGHTHHAHAPTDIGGHEGHGDDPSSNSCCSACGPTIPPEPSQFAAASMLRETPEPVSIRALTTRPPYPAYEATGPPLLI